MTRPDELEPYDEDVVSDVPVGILPGGVIIGSAMSRNDVRVLNAAASAAETADITLLEEEVRVPRILTEFPYANLGYAGQGCISAVNARPGEVIGFTQPLGYQNTISGHLAYVQGHQRFIRVDDEDLDVFYSGIRVGSENVVNELRAVWVATPGTHTVSTDSTLPDFEWAGSCTFTIEG